jgi:hypothetical protein
VLTRIEVATGITQALVTGATWGAGGSWGPDGTILFGRHGAPAIQAIAADGRRIAMSTTRAPGGVAQIRPHFLPDGRHFLYYVEGLPEVRGVYASELVTRVPNTCGRNTAPPTGDPIEVPRIFLDRGIDPDCVFAANSPPRPADRRLVDAEAGGVYALGRLFFVQGGTLMAQPFDPATLALSGSPQPVADQIPVARTGAALSATGDHVIYRQGLQGSLQQLTWFDREGNRLRTVGEPFRTGGGASSLSPDGTRVVVNRVVDALGKIFTVDLASGTASRLSNDPANNSYPIWSFDGQSVLFSSNRSGFFDTYRQSPYFGTEAQPVFATPASYRHPMDWSRDGRYLIYRMSSSDVWALDVATSTEIRIAPAPARWPQISPDGRWIAYQADAADGTSEIYIHGPFDPPELGRRSEPISIGGGGWARWGANGHELYYVAADGWLMAVALSFSGDSIFAAEPERLFNVPMTLGSLNRGQAQQYMVDNRGTAFLVLESTRVVSPVHRLGR